MKMPNDIFVEQKKICGILTNMITTGGAFDPDGSPWWWGSNRAKNEEVSLLVVGVGVNTWYQEKENRFECSNLFDCISSGENFEEPSSREERIKQLGDNLHTEIGIAMLGPAHILGYSPVSKCSLNLCKLTRIIGPRLP
eukprot:Trichotokara_eunicae@DN6226_c0_g1_i4.p1